MGTRGLVSRVGLASLLGAGCLATAGPASADAFSCTGYGTIGVPRTSVKIARWCGQTTGRGTWVSSVKGGFFAVTGTWLCNTAMRVEFVDRAGRAYAARSTSSANGCLQANNYFGTTWNQQMRAGTVRVSLLSNGATIATVEQTIS